MSERTQATSVDEYIAQLPPDRQRTVSEIRQLILGNLPVGYEEIMDFGMISYVVPLSLVPRTYNGHPLLYAALASQKQYVSLYLMNVYGDPKAARWFLEEYRASGKKLDMGKSCVRFKRPEDLPMDLIVKAIARTPVEQYVQRAREILATHSSQHNS